MVLEAREKAEEVGYSLVWQETKEASNAVDYNINEEITKDASAVENANNQTTTGMATVIPWINAPKLIASTSIYWWWWSTKYCAALYKNDTSMSSNTYTRIELSTIDATPDFTTREHWVEIVSPWTYLLAVYTDVPWKTGTNEMITDIRLYRWGNYVWTHLIEIYWTFDNKPSWARRYTFSAGDQLGIYCSSWSSSQPYLYVTLIKLS